MKPGFRFLVATSAAVVLTGCAADSSTGPIPPTVPLLGNGFPNNGKATLYKMNIIGHPGTPTADMLMSQGKRIFVRLNGNTRINLTEGPFGITDPNGTDGTAAFTLPDPDPDDDGVTWYGVYLRPKGKPGQEMHLTTCGTGDFDNDPLTPDEELCSLEVAIAVRGTGKPKVENVSKQLLTMCVSTDGDLKCDERIFLFDDRAHDYVWSVDNYGLRNVEVRFLEIPQNIGLTP